MAVVMILFLTLSAIMLINDPDKRVLSENGTHNYADKGVFSENGTE